MSDRIDEALDAVEYLFRLVPEHTCYESFDRAVAALATLRAEVARLREEAAKAEQEVEDEIQRRDRYHDAITEAHIALGGDGEWRAHVGGSPPIGESGHLHLDVPVMARRLREEVARLRAFEQADRIDAEEDDMRDAIEDQRLRREGREAGLREALALGRSCRNDDEPMPDEIWENCRRRRDFMEAALRASAGSMQATICETIEAAIRAAREGK